MACLVSFTFSAPFSAPKTLIQTRGYWIGQTEIYIQDCAKDTYPRGSVGRRLLNRATCRAAVKVLGHKYSDNIVFSLTRSCHRHIMAGHTRFSEPFSRHFNVSSGTLVISGFWVGPGIEDGCGLIEALVNRIF